MKENTMAVTSYDPSLRTTSEAAGYVRLSKATLELWRKQRKGPSYLKLGNRVFYRATDLNTWLENQVQGGSGE